MASDTKMRSGVRVCQWRTYQFLQHISILSLLVLISGASGTTHNEVAIKDGPVLEGSFYDTASGSPTDAEVADEDDETNEESEESVLSANDQELTSNVELKTVARHTERPASGAAARELVDPAEARRRYEAQKAQDEADLAAFRKKYDQVVEEMKVASAAHQIKPKKSGIYSNEPTAQERLYRTHKEEVARLSPEQMNKLMASRQQEVAARKEMRKKYGDVVKELKQKLAERQARRQSSGNAAGGVPQETAAAGAGRTPSSLRRRQRVL